MGVIKFGTDGWRAVIAGDFTFSNVERVAQATADYWSANPVADTEKLVIVGYDRRFLSDQFGQRAADNTSTRATSTPARTARARGLSADNRANASDSVKAVDWAPTLAGMTAAASATQITALRIKPRMKLVWADDGRARQNQIRRLR